jgi:hypothetical protein
VSDQMYMVPSCTKLSAVLHGLDLSCAIFSKGYIMILNTFRYSLCKVRNKERIKTQKETIGYVSIT